MRHISSGRVSLWLPILAILVYLQAVEGQRRGPNQNEPKEPKNEPKSAEQSVRGKVVNRDHKAVANAVVVLAGKGKQISASTNEEGVFSLKAAPGDYDVTVTVGGKAKPLRDKRATIEGDQLRPNPLTVEEN